jgi:hypothetical protein
MKKFGDLKKGDNVFLVMFGPEKWIIHTYKVLKAELGESDIKLTLEDENWSGHYPKNLISARASMIWSDKEKAFQFALEKAKKERDYLSRKIDEMISKYDEIEKFIDKYEGC